MHNGLNFDAPVIERLCGVKFKKGQVYDTLVTSRLLFPTRRSHALRTWGEDLGFEKGDWSVVIAANAASTGVAATFRPRESSALGWMGFSPGSFANSTTHSCPCAISSPSTCSLGYFSSHCKFPIACISGTTRRTIAISAGISSDVARRISTSSNLFVCPRFVFHSRRESAFRFIAATQACAGKCDPVVRSSALA